MTEAKAVANNHGVWSKNVNFSKFLIMPTFSARIPLELPVIMTGR